MIRAAIVSILLALAGCAYTMPECHTGGEDYTGADACH